MKTLKELSGLLAVGETDPSAEDGRLAGLAALAQRMGRSPSRDDPVREIMARLGDNWSALIIKILATGRYRHSTLQRIIGALASEGEITQRMLTLRLRALERDGLVRRSELPLQPPRMIYELTPLGISLEAELDKIIHWIETHDAEIQRARATFVSSDD